MALPTSLFVFKDVPLIENGEFPDFFADVLCVVLSYQDEGVVERCTLLKEYRIKPGHRHGILRRYLHDHVAQLVDRVR